jgi:transcriptional regulator NrdR family protein
MICPHCSSKNHKVPVTNGQMNDQIVRKRLCNDCGHIWFTVEVIVPKYAIGWSSGLQRKPVLRVPAEVTTGMVRIGASHEEAQDSIQNLLDANRRKSEAAQLRHSVTDHNSRG